MRNKWMIAVLAGALCVPAFAAEPAVDPVKADKKPAVTAKKGEFLKAQKEHRAKMKATEDKMEKLVKDYRNAKGAKQEAKKAEIAAEVAKIREEQLKFEQEQLERFSKRLEEMKQRFEKAKTDEGKKAWVDEKTEALILQDGDLEVLFERPNRGMNGEKGPHFKGRKDGKAPHRDGEKEMEHEGHLPPPPIED